jgi:GDP-L-fucose synthase
MDKNSKIYIAGHTGLVGSAILRRLRLDGYNNLVFKTHEELDLTKQQNVADFFAKEQPEYVFLAAAKVGGIYANDKYRASFIYENLQIQNNVIHQSYVNNVKKLLFLGSSCIYLKNSNQPITENTLLTGELEYTNEPYAIAKIAGIKMCESYNLQYGTNFISVMPTNLYGPNDNFNLETSHVVPAIIRKMVLAAFLMQNKYIAIAKNLNLATNNESEIDKNLFQYGIFRRDTVVTLKLWGTGTPYRELLHVDDMVDACLFIMQKINFKDLISNPKEVRNTHINIGSGEDVTIAQLVNIIRTNLSFHGVVEFDATKPDGVKRKLLNVNKLNSLGWKHKIKLNDGIATTVNWYLRSL